MRRLLAAVRRIVGQEAASQTAEPGERVMSAQDLAVWVARMEQETAVEVAHRLPAGVQVLVPPPYHPLHREDLFALSPLVVAGCHTGKSERVAAWLRAMGNVEDPWALVLRAPKGDFLDTAMGRAYLALNGQGWNVVDNAEPPTGMPRVYVFEDVWQPPSPEPGEVPDPGVIDALSEHYPVIVVPDPDGMLPDYLQPAQEAYLATLWCGWIVGGRYLEMILAKYNMRRALAMVDRPCLGNQREYQG